MTDDNEKLFEAASNIGHVIRETSFMMLPEEEPDHRPFLLMNLKQAVDTAVKQYMKDPANAERVEYYRLGENDE